MNTSTETLLSNDAANLLEHSCSTIARERLQLPGPDFIQRVVIGSDRNQRVMADGIELLNRIQDVYLDKAITIA